MANILAEKYASLHAGADYKNRLRQQEFKVSSQNGEDGLILFILSQIGAKTRTFVEFGFGDGRQCNAANLIRHFGWKGLMMDGNPDSVRSAKAHYAALGIKEGDGLNIRKCFVTAENINGKLREYGMSGEVDLLSIDIDGNDYWLWKAIDAVSPRLLVIEYNASFGSERSITVLYDPAFDRYKKHPSGWYHGASLKALEKLGREKGYALVGCNSDGVNAFFVRADLLQKPLQEITADEAYYPTIKREHICSTEEQFSKIRHLEFTEI